jgi:hypothetical protein
MCHAGDESISRAHAASTVNSLLIALLLRGARANLSQEPASGQHEGLLCSVACDPIRQK